ncbi:MAG: lysylphosphatidylglycerol synthase domain-containing protein, partial [Gammaproteobacteria bacterium]|nr:lysylphosphatidylglycerol synthase domain-containing protein [Gammaproteobacteria bacterium]
MKKLLTPLRFALAAGMLYFLFRSGAIDWRSLSHLLLEWNFTLVAIFLFFLATVLHALRLRVLINGKDLRLTFLASTKLTFIGLFFNTY